MAKREWCKNYNGFGLHKQCDAGVSYEPYRPYSVHNLPPCLSEDSTMTPCATAIYPTPEEVAVYEAKLEAEFQRMMQCNEQWICRHCGAEILNEKQVGRCVYAEPCGHRLYQGRARGKRPAKLSKSKTE